MLGSRWWTSVDNRRFVSIRATSRKAPPPARLGSPAVEERRVNRTATLTATVAAAGIVQLPTAAIVVALPTIHREFGTSIPELQWTVTAFMIPFSALLIAAGRLADIFGRRLVLFIGTALFAAGSALAAASPDVVPLIAGIALAGTGGALMMPSSMSILTNVFTGARRGFAIGMWGAATELVSGIGVLVGGILTGELDWRWIFGVDIAFAVLIVVLALRGAPESRDPTVSRDVDVGGVVLSAAALTSLTLALIQGATWGWGSTAVVALLVAAVVLFAAFAIDERRSSHPLVDFGFFRHRNFAGATIVIFVLDFSFGALLFFLPLYFQEILGYSPTEVGVLLLPLTGLMVVGSPLGGRVAARVGPRPPIAIGLALMAVAVYLISGLSLDTGYGSLWLPSAMMGFGVGFSLTPMNLAAMNAISRDHAGAASGMLVTLSGMGATLGVAVTGAIFNELQTERTVSQAKAAGVAVSRGKAQTLDGLLTGTPGARQSLHQLAGAKSAAVEHGVREAFVSALGTSLKLSAALIAAGLVLAIVLLRRTPADAAPPAVPVLGAPTPRPAPRPAMALEAHGPV
jgi:EmrB/QacA subfamily drug resistance transporter